MNTAQGTHTAHRTVSGRGWTAGASVTVVIPTWNRSQSLARTLESISRCRIPSGLIWELVLVNNNCTDDTDRIAKKFSQSLPVLYVREQRQGLSRAKNAGLAAASGDLIIFTDDDVEVCEDWIVAYWFAYLEKPSGFYFGGPVISRFETAPPEAELLALAPADVRGFDWGEKPKVLSKREYFIGPNWAGPLKPLNALGGFDVDKGLDPSRGALRVGEETDLMERLQEGGFSPWYLPEAKVRHFVPARKCTLKDIAARGEAWGFYEATTNPREFDGPRILGIPRWMYRQAGSHALTYVRARCAGRDAAKGMVGLRYTIGLMRAFRQVGRDRAICANHDTTVTQVR